MEAELGSSKQTDSRAPIAKLIKHQLENLLQMIDLECRGTKVSVDAFGRRGESHPPSRSETCEHDLRGSHHEVLECFRSEEPRLVMTGNLLHRVLKVVELQSGGRTVPVDGFRLKNLAYWARYPSSSIIENFGRIAGKCNCDCEFCFLKGTPSEDPRVILPVSEARTRAKYYSAEKRVGLPTPLRWNGEPFINPRMMDILAVAREAQPDRMLEITTNGDFLTEETIDRLATLKPLLLVISLNSADVDTRERMMKSGASQVAVHSIPLLREKGIRFMGSVVTWPSLSVDDIERTACYLDDHQALQIRFLLPGYTRFRSETPLFDTKETWDATVRLARSLRTQLRTPIVVQPSTYWNRDIRAFIDGIYRNSPAERAGLRFGDRILEIDGARTDTKSQAADLLSPVKRTNGIWRRSLKLQRGGDIFRVDLTDDSRVEDDFYPYKPKGYPLVPRSRGGIHLIDGFRPEYLRRLKESITKHPSAKAVLLFSTALASELFGQARTMFGGQPEFSLDGVELTVTVARHHYWGGNIMVADIHVVQDYIDHLNFLNAKGYRPDLVAIPSSFASRWGYDVTGRSFMEIQRETGIPVELLPTKPVIV